MEPTSPRASTDAEPPTPPPVRRRRRWWLWILLLLVVAVVLLIALAPLLISLPPVRRGIQAAIAENVRGPVALQDIAFSWSSGVTIDGLELGNPPGFPNERPALRLRHATVDFGILALLGGRVRAAMEVDGLELFVEQNADGKTNLDQLPEDKGSASQPPSPDGGTGGKRPSDGPPANIDLAFDMRDCLVEIRRQGELLERLDGLELHAGIKPGDEHLRADGAAKLLAGQFAFHADVDLATKATEGHLDAHGLDLARWQPLVDAFLPGQLTALAGKIEGALDVTMTPAGDLQLGGDLVVAGPRIAGALVRGMDVRSETWKVTPVLALGKDAATIDASKFAVDLGWFTLRGKPATDGALAFDYSLDVAALAKFGGPMPAQLQTSGMRLDGDVTLKDGTIAKGTMPKDAAGWIDAISAKAALVAPQLELAGVSLRSLGVDLTVAGGNCAIASRDTTQLEGGPLLVQLGVDLHDLGKLPTTASLQWNGGKLTAPVAQGLRYAMPLLAGIDENVAGIDENVAGIVGECDLQLNMNGPAAKADDQTWLAWLDLWRGDGALGLKNAGFAPSPQLQGLLAPLGPLSSKALPLGENGRLTIDAFRAPFSFADGVVRSTASEWLAKGQKIGLAGSVGLDGKLDYALDLTALLKGHKDGEKVLQALGGALPKANLKGSLDAPALALPELGDLAQKLLEQQGKDLLKKGLEDIFKR